MSFVAPPGVDPITAAKQSQAVLQEVLADARSATDPLAAIAADPRLQGVTVYADPTTCGIAGATLTPHTVTSYGCPACPHVTMPMPASTYFNNAPAEGRLDLLEQMGTQSPSTLWPAYVAPPTTTAWSTVVVAVATGTLAVGGVLGLVSQRGEQDSAVERALKRPCVSATPRSADVDAPTVACNTIDADGIQIIEIQLPKKVPLRFAYCDGRVCGDADPECASNKWMPQFAGAMARRVVVGPIAGGSVDSAATSGAKAPATAESSVSVGVSNAVVASLRMHLRDGRVCGYTDEEYQAFRGRFGSEYVNENTTFRIAVRWRSGSAGTPPPVRFE